MRSGPLLLALVVSALALAFPLGVEWSDSHFLVTNAGPSPRPYYNVAYLPIAHAAIVSGAAIGWEAHASLFGLSALALGFAAWMGARWLRELGVAAAWTPWLTALVVMSPGAFFHGTVIEVHAVALGGALVALVIATRARTQPTKRAHVLVGAALGIALVTHLSHVLLLPGLVWLARGSEPGRGLRFGTRAVWVAGVVITIAGALGIYWVTRDPSVWDRRGGLQWAGTLVQFASGMWARRAETGWFTPAEMASYLGREAVVPNGVLWVAPMLLLAGWRALADRERRIALDALPLLVLPALVLSQGGVFERGGYFLVFGPVLALWAGLGLGGLKTRNQRIAPWILAPLLIVQAVWTLADQRALREQLASPRSFASEAASECLPGDRVLVCSLARYFSLHALRPDIEVWDLERELALIPSAARDERVFRSVGRRLVGAPGTTLRIDPLLLEDSARHAAGPLKRLLEDDRLKLVRDPDTRLLRVEAAAR